MAVTGNVLRADRDGDLELFRSTEAKTCNERSGGGLLEGEEWVKGFFMGGFC